MNKYNFEFMQNAIINSNGPMTITKAKNFILSLFKQNMIYHFDDGAIDCLYNNGLCTLKVAKNIDTIIELIRESDIEWGNDEDMFGYSLNIAPDWPYMPEDYPDYIAGTDEIL